MVNTVLVPTLGVTLIGIFISTALYGATSMQSYSYFQKFWHTDSWGLKALIALIWSLETTHVFLVCAYIFRALILEFNDPVALGRTKVSDDVTTGITALIILVVHCFYARRLWILSNRNITLISVVMIIAIGHFALEMVVMVLTFRFPEFTEFHKITPYYTAALALAAADDIIIAAAMFYLLMGRKTGIKSTNALLTRIVTYSISTGILTSVVDIVILICFVAMPNNLVYLTFYDFINNLYANSLLAMLNARESLREARSSVSNISTSFQFSDLRSKGSENTVQQQNRANHLNKVPWTSINVDTETETTV